MSFQHSDKKAYYPCIYCKNVYAQVGNFRLYDIVHNQCQGTGVCPVVMLKRIYFV